MMPLVTKGMLSEIEDSYNGDLNGTQLKNTLRGCHSFVSGTYSNNATNSP